MVAASIAGPLANPPIVYRQRACSFRAQAGDAVDPGVRAGRGRMSR